MDLPQTRAIAEWQSPLVQVMGGLLKEDTLEDGRKYYK